MFETMMTSAPVSGQRRTAVTKGKILKEAAIIFARRGFSGANLRAIAEAANVKQPIINYHFGSKKNSG